MAIFSKPENALKRADELINVGQKQEAFQTLHDVITSRRYRGAWQKPLERIMFKYVELCVELRQGRLAKDGLIQYRIACQQVNINSLEEVIKHFLDLATQRAEQARKQAQAVELEALDVVEDLEEFDKRPEDLMLSYVSGGEKDRELVTPWFKFLWETYRTVLEILKNNSRLEALYAMTAHRAFQFCKQYKRTTEFRRLCEVIRNHLANMIKYKDQRDNMPDLSAPESLQLYLDTRFEQLKVATELELWQEAFRSVEDIHGLMCLVKKTPKSSLMVVYYAKLTEIFSKSSSHLFHAYAWLKLFFLQKGFNKNLSQKDLQLIASSVVLAALSVLPYNHLHGASHLELEIEKERNLTVASLINFDVDPKKAETRQMLSRSSLLAELVSKGVMSCATQEVQDLHHLLENEFIPLDLASKVQPLLTKISNLGGKLSSAPSVPEIHLSQYLSSIERLATLRLLQQASKVYQTVKIENLSKLIPFFDFSYVEKISVDAFRHGFISMKVDHMQNAVFFSQQNLDHLALSVESLSKARAMVYPPAKKAKKTHELDLSLSSLLETVEKEHNRLLARKSIIEKRKEEQERQVMQMEREEELKRLKLEKITQEAEQRRLVSESDQRKRQRADKEKQEREREEAEAIFQDVVKGNKKKKQKGILGVGQGGKNVMELALTEQFRERQEAEKKLLKLARTMDHLERAKREEEAPVIDTAFLNRLVEEAALHEHEQQNEIFVSRQRHVGDLEEKQRLTRILNDKETFQAQVVHRRDIEQKRLTEERQARLNEIIETRKQERETRRKMLYHLQTEEERLRRQRQEEEEEEARKREDLERKRKEEAERQAKLNEIAEKQRQRERELEEKEKWKEEAAPAAPAPGKYVPKFLRAQQAGSCAVVQPLRAETDRWGSGGSKPNDQQSWRRDEHRPKRLW